MKGEKANSIKEAWLREKNPILRLWAWKELLPTEKQQQLCDAFLASGHYEKSAMISIILTSAIENQGKVPIDATPLITSCATPQELRPFIVGILANHSCTAGYARKFVNSIRDEVAKRYTKLQTPDSEPDKILEALLARLQQRLRGT